MTNNKIEGLERKVGEVCAALRLLANKKRLLVLCLMAGAGEMSVGALAEAVDLSQSALSQHLARLRADGLVTARRDAQVLYYRISDERVGRVLEALHGIYCAEDGSDRNAAAAMTAQTSVRRVIAPTVRPS